MKYRVKEVKEKRVNIDETVTTFTYYPEFKDLDLWLGFGIKFSSLIEARKFIENEKLANQRLELPLLNIMRLIK